MLVFAKAHVPTWNWGKGGLHIGDIGILLEMYLEGWIQFALVEFPIADKYL